ncbi:uncharacterized protein LOC121880195 isoform X3 [Homarus americanus]|uniref:uncharacterized protein LOC121880195 isoform X3 n=1 Tax=Homarus americanus TaxID=6706 RepID=UPI001C43DD95|nr:uncharacterized protein LOC121880195 isoform X3 [Homarus americanus]
MGCGTSQAVQVIEEDPAKTPTTLEATDELTSVRSNTPDLNSKPVDPPSAPPILSNGTESSGPPIEENLPQTPVEETPPQSAGGRAVAFEVGPADSSESIIRRHPPRKFQKLEELQQESSSLTQEKLEEKQATAERRRQEILTQRVQSAKHRSARSSGRLTSQTGHADEVDQQGDGIIESAATVTSENEL